MILEVKRGRKERDPKGLDILFIAKLPRPSMFIPPVWYLSRQCIEELKELNFNYPIIIWNIYSAHYPINFSPELDHLVPL
jgi:predicted deacetylase